MALINPSSLFSGGNVRLDSTPYLRMALQQRARRQALDEASTQYFTKLPEKLNTAGVRSVDMQDPNGHGGIQNDIENWQSKWALNKDAIKRGGMAQQDFMMDFNKIRQKIDESKNRGKTELLIGKEALKPNGWKPRTHDHPVIEAVGRSIYDPASKKEDGVSEYGLNDLSLAAAPYTPQYELKHDKVITANVQPDKLPNDTGVFDPISKKVTYNYGYTPEKVDQIVQTGLATLASDKTLYNHYEDLLDKPDQVELASKYLQADYDKKHTDGLKVVVDTPEEMYAGLNMAKYSNASIPKSFTDKKSIDEYNATEWNRREAQRQINREKMAGLNDRLIRKRKVDGVDTGEVEVDYPTNVLADELGEDVKLNTGRETSTKKIIYVDKIPVGTLRGINPKDINKGIYPVQPLEAQQPDGSYRSYYEIEDDANGNKQYKGKGGKVIGAEDARNNFIKEVVPTKVKLKTTYNKPGTNKAASSKSISSGTIKSLVGKKGYEGYSEKELMDYYKSNGYEIK